MRTSRLGYFRVGCSIITVAMLVGVAGCGDADHLKPTVKSSMSAASMPPLSSVSPDTRPSGTTGDRLSIPEAPWWHHAPTSAPTPQREPVTIALGGDLLFEPDSAVLTLGALSQLSALRATYLSGPASTSIDIVGHTDAGTRGTRQDALDLSAARAAAVKEWMVGTGLRRDAITIRGVGDDEPLYPSDTDEHRSANRRCDITITTKEP